MKEKLLLKSWEVYDMIFQPWNCDLIAREVQNIGVLCLIYWEIH